MIASRIAPALLLLVMPLAAAAQTTAYERHHIAPRKVNQQKRIGQGVHSGQLTPGETRHLETQQRGLKREERGMRAQDNGHLTATDRHATEPGVQAHPSG